MVPSDPSGLASDLRALVEHAQRCLAEQESADLNEFLSASQTEEEQQEAELWANRARDEAADGIAWALRSLADRLLLYCEALALPETRRIVQAWRTDWPDSKLKETRPWSNSEADGRGSPALDQIRPVVDGLIALLQPAASKPSQTAAEKFELDRLEHCLRSIAKIVRERNVDPGNEHDILAVLHSHLEGVFDDYTRTVTIAKPVLSFKPDGGVVSLRAAIECKFVDSENELAAAMHGIYEDLSGYAGSTEWTTFYSLIYMTAPFTTERHVSRALGLSGNAGTWTTIVVTGVGARVKKGRPHKAAPQQGPTQNAAGTDCPLLRE